VIYFSLGNPEPPPVPGTFSAREDGVTAAIDYCDELRFVLVDIA
jgi:hypothetical protein